MRQESIDDLVSFYLDKKRKGMDFSEIDRELKAKNINQEKITFIVRAIDKEIVKELTTKSNSIKSSEVIYIGYFLLTIGLIFTVGTYSGYINSGNHYLLLYGPILAGVGLIFKGMNMK
tara:strand:- start:2365 stop:2718 length:354 start_codon:yes stop_codon:yes gene_type:complete